VIASLLWQQGILFNLFCEHYRDREPGDIRGEETFDWVEFTWQGETAVHANWKPGSREQVEALIGRKFE
jgi:hypothetical protein